MKRLLIAFAALAAAGCSSTAAPGALFDDEQQADISCMRHQEQQPGEEYLNEDNWDTNVSLPILRYYTSHGRKPYCDGASATDADQGWRKLYVQMGADENNLAQK